MKKRMALLLAALMLASLFACGKKNGGTNGASPPENGKTQTGTSQTGTSQTGAAPDGKIVDCAGAYDFYEKLTDALSKKMSVLIDAHNEAAGSDFSQYVVMLYMPFSALRYLDAASYTRDTSPATMEASYRLMELNDAVVTQSGNEYTITYTAKRWNSGTTYAFKEVIRFDPDAPALSVVKYADGVLTGFTEFQALGGDRYALSSELERAIVTYRDGEILAFDHAENKWELNADADGYEPFSFLFGHDSGAIFGRTDPDHDWVMEAEQHDGLYRHYSYRDGVCTVTGLSRQRNWDTGEYTFTPGYELTLP